MENQSPGDGPKSGSSGPPEEKRTAHGTPPAGNHPSSADRFSPPGDGAPNDGQRPPGGGPPTIPPVPRPRITPTTILLFVFLLVIGAWAINRTLNGSQSKITYSFFRDQLAKGNVVEVEASQRRLTGTFKHAPDKPPPLKKEDAEEEKPAKTAEADKKYDIDFYVDLPETALTTDDLDKAILAAKVRYSAQPNSESLTAILIVWVLPMLLIGGLIWFMWSTRNQIMGGGGLLSGFIKSPAKRYNVTRRQITFANVAGLEGVKHDLQEVVEFLKNPEKFQRLGGHVPKGILLMGPPGTGKTLLARAVAGEAEVPFFSISGSEFIQMFVGVGASRVRDMFRTAKEAAPSILFIDEIDAVGRHRGAGLGGGHDEREQTLNQILSEMDGFSPNESVIVLAATNRPDVLDPALLRPGRFDRHVTVDRPNLKGRVAIFKVHVRGVTLGADVDLERLARGTVGLTGADIRNLVNEAALWATRNGKDKVEMEDFEYARDKLLMGPKREEVLTGKEKTMTAYHEAGHALLAWVLPGVDRLHKVTIIPRGRALGVTQLVPEEDRYSISESELRSRLILGLGGRAAEKLIFHEYSAGAESDLTHVTKLARRMVANWGMSDRLGPVAYRTSEEHPFLGREIYEQREFSEHTAQLIDEEVSRILHEAAGQAEQLLAEHRGKLDSLAKALEEHEVLDESELEELIGPSNRRQAELNGSNGSTSEGPAAKIANVE